MIHQADRGRSNLPQAAGAAARNWFKAAKLHVSTALLAGESWGGRREGGREEGGPHLESFLLSSDRWKQQFPVLLIIVMKTQRKRRRGGSPSGGREEMDHKKEKVETNKSAARTERQNPGVLQPTC